MAIGAQTLPQHVISQRALALWARKRLSSVHALEAIAAIQSSLSAEFAEILLFSLSPAEKHPIEKQLWTAWRLLCKALIDRDGEFHSSSAASTLLVREGASSSAEAIYLAKALAPRLEVKLRRRWNTDAPRIVTTANDVVHYELKTTTDVEYFANEALSKAAKWDARTLNLLLDECTSRLIETLSIGSEAQLFDEHRRDLSDFNVPSIEQHAQNENHHGLQPLVRACVVSFDVSARLTKDAARATAERWRVAPFRLTKRLWLHALRQSQVFTSDEALLALLAIDSSLLLTIPREVPMLVRERFSDLNQQQISRFVERCVEVANQRRSKIGYGLDIEGADRKNLSVDRAVWRIFSSLKSAGVVFEAPYQHYFEELRVRHPWLRHPLLDRDYFDSWTGETRTVTGKPELIGELPAEAKIEAAIQLAASRDSDEQESWAAYCRLDPTGALQALIKHPVDRITARLWARWMWAIQAATNGPDTNVAELAVKAFAYLEEASNDVLDLITYDLVQGFEAAHAHRAAISNAWWDRLWASSERTAPDIKPISLDTADASSQAVSAALNGAAGRLSSFVLTRISDRPVDQRKATAPERQQLHTIISSESYAGLLGRVSLVMEFGFVWFVARDLVRQQLQQRLERDDNEGTLLRLVLVESSRLRQPASVELWPIIVRGIHESRAAESVAEAIAVNLLLAAVGSSKKDKTVSARRDDARRLLHETTPAVRRQVVSVLATWLERASETNRAKLWRDRLGPTLLAIWPRAVAFRDAATALPFARLIVATESELPNALETLQPYLMPVADKWPHLPWPRREGERMAKAFPRDMLSLLWALLGNDTSRQVMNLRELLGAMKDADPEIEQDRRYNTLRDMTLR